MEPGYVLHKYVSKIWYCRICVKLLVLFDYLNFTVKI
jgi:hypothetical protein